MKNKTKSIVLNSSLAIFLLLFFGFLSTVVVFRAPPEYMDRNNKKRFNIEMPATPMETSGDTAVLPLKYITFSLGLKGYLWCASAFLLIFLTIRNLINLIFSLKIVLSNVQSCSMRAGVDARIKLNSLLSGACLISSEIYFCMCSKSVF